jgi:outer membrane protein assembly factor BamB
VNPIKKIKTILLLVIVLTFFGVINYSIIPFGETNGNTPPESIPFPSINTIEITYTETSKPLTYRFYKIEPINGKYYSNTGTKVEPQLITHLKDSFTDLYISEYQKSYNDFSQIGVSPHFDVTITLTTGKKIIAKSDSDYHCFIPWNVIYDGSVYVQYNGKIPGALLEILVRIDPDTWTPYKKVVKFGCYSVEPVTDSVLSHAFPHTEQGTPLSEKGSSHVVWSTPLENSISLDYEKGVTVVSLPDRVVSLSESGNVMWDFPFEHKGLCKTNNVCIHGHTVCVGAPDKVYSIDGETGDVIWEFNMHSPCSQVTVVHDTVLVIAKGIICLNTHTGDVIWEITENTWNEKIYDDTILFAVLGEDTTYYRLINILTGEVLWEEDFFEVQYPVYHNGAVYFLRPKDRFVFQYTIETGEEVWLYPFAHAVQQVEMVGNHLLLIQYNESQGSITGITLLNIKNIDAWNYTYAQPVQSDNPLFVTHYQNILLIGRDPGVVEAFDMENGTLLWRNEVRGHHITSFFVYENNIYITATDGRIYCLNEYGTIVWRYTVEHELQTYPESPYVYISIIEDGFIFVITENRVYVFSVN